MFSRRSYQTNKADLAALERQAKVLRLATQTVTYTYTGNNFDYVDSPADGSRVTATLVLNKPIPPNVSAAPGNIIYLSGGHVPDIYFISATVSNGVDTYSMLGADPELLIVTDSNGKISSWVVSTPLNTLLVGSTAKFIQAVSPNNSSSHGCESYVAKKPIYGTDTVGVPVSNGYNYCGVATKAGAWSGPTF